MPVSKKQQGHVHKYIKNHYDRMEIMVPKGRREFIKNIADSKGISVNMYITNLILSDIGLTDEEWKGAGDVDGGPGELEE